MSAQCCAISQPLKCIRQINFKNPANLIAVICGPLNRIAFAAHEEPVLGMRTNKNRWCCYPKVN